MRHNIVIGGGITGLFSAHTLRSRFPNVPTILVEAAPEVGGLLKSKYYGDHGAFDYGIHAFYETGIAEIDDYLLGLPIDWKFLTRYERDLGGAAWDGSVNYDAPYLDLRKAPNRAKYLSEIHDVMAACTCNLKTATPATDADTWLKARFGSSLTNDYLKKTIEARQHQPIGDTHWLAAPIQGLGRVVLHDEDAVLKSYKDERFSSRIAFPDQRSYPEDILPDRRAYYPKEVGMGRVIDAIADDLSSRGIRIRTNCRVTKSSLNNGRINSVQITNKDGDYEHVEVERLVCAAPLPTFLFTLDEKPKPMPFQKPHQTVICNFLSRERPRDGDLYYLYFHGHERAHRVSFPYNYSDEDPAKRGYAMCVECVYPQGVSVDDAGEVAKSALLDHRIISDPEHITFEDCFVSSGGFPNLSVGNIAALSSYRDHMQNLKIGNFDSVGILARDDLFFQFDLIKHANEVLV